MTSLQLIKSIKSPRTHCKHGHLRNKRTVYVNHNGTITCRICQSAAARRWYDKRKGLIYMTPLEAK
jgi:hypothetical protein